VLVPGVQEIIDDTGADAEVIGTVRRHDDGLARTMSTLAHAYVHGADLTWDAAFPDARRVDLPTYAFQHRRFWRADTRGARPRVGTHPFLAEADQLADGTQVFTGSLSVDETPWLAEHCVVGVPIVPGALFVELALHAASRTGYVQVDELMLEQPLRVPDTGRLAVQVLVGEPGQDGARDLRIYARAGDDEEWTRYVSGTLALTEAASTTAPQPWPPEKGQPLDLTDLRARFAAHGYWHGPDYHGLRTAWRHGQEILSEVWLPDSVRDEAVGFNVHPLLLDASMHANDLTAPDDQPTLLPFCWTKVRLHTRGATGARVRSLVDGHSTSFALTGEDGGPILTVDSVALRPLRWEWLAALPRGGLRDCLYSLAWKPSDSQETTGSCAVLGDDPLALASATGFPAYLDLPTLRAAIASGAPVPDVVLTGVSTEPDQPSVTSRVLDLAQRWLGAAELSGTALAVVTRGAVRLGPREPADFDAAALWGLIRSAQLEHPGRFALADIDRDPASVAVLHSAVSRPEPRVAIREGTVLLPQLRRAGPGEALTPPPSPHWRLDTTAPGTLDGLTLLAEPSPEEALPPGRVRVAVRAAGLNFRDVQLALGMHPGEARMGSEAAGVITDVGPDVTGVAVGDRVLGLFDGGAFGPVADTDQRVLARIPADWSFATAASVPVAFLTAWYALVDLAGIKPGDRVLIHAAAGGVGMASVQIARHLGAKVYATASFGKHESLRDLGCADIADSRTLEFAERFSDAGIDIVLNSLTGKFIDASLRLLRPGGRMVELGKTDRRDADQVAVDYPGVRYLAFDLAGAGPDRTGEMLGELLPLLSDGTLHPLPISAWHVQQAPAAMRWMSLAKHVGKIVLTMPRRPAPDDTILITGGTGTLGGHLARHLARQGHTRLLLLSRRGPAAPGAAELVAGLAALGAEATVVACDVGERQEIAEIIDAIPPQHPLTAVIHAAGVLDDGAFTALTPDRLNQVLRPKADAALTLHELTRPADLAWFVLFSSAAGVFGSPGQANYSAASTVLDALAAHRRTAGLPGQSVGWGFWADRSAMTGKLSDADLARSRRAGLYPMSTEDGLALFDLATESAEAFLVAARLTPEMSSDVQARRAPLGTPPGRLPDQGTGPPTLMPGALLALVRVETAVVLGHDDPAAIAPDAPFTQVGIDSLTAVELRNRIAARTGLRLPGSLVFDHPTPLAVRDHLLAELAPAPVEAEPIDRLDTEELIAMALGDPS
jgi:NADPH:quinone reductase-like Zn-dependent oxidoreductase/NADP-dependent 3-hydroxy acid dehydrogenase YdfG